MGCGCSSASKHVAQPAAPAPAVAQPPAALDLPRNADLAGLLGPRLLSGSSEAGTTEALAGKRAVALYFSAHWCPPCRGFTPQLAQWYSKSLRDKGLEVVFVSSDKDEASFRQYFKEMPWLALPYSDRARKEALSKRFKVQGIPSLVILDADGRVITKDGRSAVAGDPTGDNFPWRPKALKEVLAGATLLGQSGQSLGADVLEGKVFALYFSAHWCPPCRGFTPQLAQWYSKSLKDKGLEVVFVSSDKDEASFQKYFKEMPWLALDFSDRKRKEELSSIFRVQGIPSLVIVGADGATITTEGRGALSSDPEGHDFPWHPKPVANLKAGPGSLQEIPTVVAFCEASTSAAQAAVVEAMTPMAQQFQDEQKAAGEDDPRYSFMVATEAGGMATRLREIMGLPQDAPEAPRLMLVDLPDDGSFYPGPEGEVTAGAVAKLLADYESKALEKRQLKRG